MLVLARKIDEVILIGGDIAVTVLAIHGDQVWLSIRAPLNVSIDCLEVRKRKDEEVADGASND